MRLVKLNSLEEKKQGLYKKQIAMTVIRSKAADDVLDNIDKREKPLIRKFQF